MSTYTRPAMSTDGTNASGIGPIGRGRLLSRIADGTITLIDALPAEAYDRRHIPTALNLVIEEADAVVSWILPDRSASIVTYSTDMGCGRGEALAERLSSMGYTDVRVYGEGIEDWVNGGLPVESGAPSSPLHH